MLRHTLFVFLSIFFFLIQAAPLQHTLRLGDVPITISGTLHDFFFRNDTTDAKSLDDDNADYDLLRLLFSYAGVEDILKTTGKAGHGFTLFAPTDEALTQSARDIREIFKLAHTDIPTVEQTAWKVYQAWFHTLDNPEKTLANILKYHIVVDKEFTRQEFNQGLVDPKLNTSNGQVILRSGITLSNADPRFKEELNPQLIMMDCYFALDNGVIHPIDRMLFPNPNGQTEDPEHVPPANQMSPSVTPTIPTEQSVPGGATGTADSVQGEPRPSPAVTPSSSTSNNDSEQPSCFPASSIVHLNDGSTISISKLSAGHTIMSSITHRKSSPVYLFSHRQQQGIHDFIRITSSHGHQITLTPGHYLYANNRKTAARSVKLGDVLQTLDGESFVTSITKVREKGLFAPHTLHGDIVVNGILASSYTTAISPRIAHTLLWPIRMLVRAGLAVEPLGGLLYYGSPRLAAIVPGGYDVY